MQSGGDWRSVVDGLRPHVQAIWRAMPSRSRQRFLEHARPWWDIHRHRMAPEVEAKIRALQDERPAANSAGPSSLRSNAKRDGASVSIRPRASEAEVRLEVSRIVSCRGLTSDPRRSSNPLVAQLVADGYARADPLGIGLDVDDDCAVVDASGRASERIFAVGPMSQAAFWESIAVPDIRLQAASLARRLTEQARLRCGSDLICCAPASANLGLERPGSSEPRIKPEETAHLHRPARLLTLRKLYYTNLIDILD